MTARVRYVLFAAVALVLAGPVLLFFLGRLVLSHDALLLDHVSERRTTLVELSLWAGADVNSRTGGGEPVASVAVREGEPEILAMLLGAGADPNARDDDGIAVVVRAVAGGDAGIVRMLLDAGADPNTLAEENLSVLAIAVDRGHTEVAQLLLDAGADPNGPGIAELVQRSGNTDLLALLEAGALTAEALLTLAELGLNALANIDKFIEGMLCIFTLGFGC